MFSFNKFFFFSLAVFLADRFLKFLLLENRAQWPGFFINQNFAFGLPLGNSASLFLALLALALFFGYVYKKNRAESAILIFFGASSNLIDRFFYGGVVDYLPLPLAGRINLADLLIFLGVVLLFFQTKKRSAYAD